MSRLMLRIGACCLSVLLAGRALAQTSTGGISGTVKDSTGAVAPQTQLTLTNLDTNEKREQKSDDRGLFSFTALAPARYRLEAERAGFKQFVLEPIEVRVQLFVSIQPVLEVGSASDKVEVKAQVALIDPNTSSLSEVVENQQITQLPVNGRNTLAFVSLTPGVNTQAGFGDNPATVNFQAWGNFQANGGVAGANAVLVDGAPVNTVLFNGIGYLPPIDATQEFRVQTNNFSAEFGRTGGAVVNLSIKSGSNQFHGSLYEFLRNDKFDANNFFLNTAGKKKGTLRYNQFGASLGGPIWRDRTFFFANYEGFRQLDGEPFIGTVPTALERAGDFSQTFLPNGALRVIVDPFSKVPYSGNVIPANKLDTAGLKLASALWPLPDALGQGPSRLNNFTSAAVQASNEDQGIMRVDHTISNVWRVFATYGQQFFNLGGWDPMGNRTTPIDGGRAETDRMQDAVISALAVFSPRVIGEFHTNFTRIEAHRTPMSVGFDLTTLGFPQSYQNSVQVHSFPDIQVSGLTGLVSSTSSLQNRISNSYTQSGSITLVRGSQTLKVGGQYTTLGWNEWSNNDGAGQFNFTGRFSGQDGFGVADMVQGYPFSGMITQSQALSLLRKYTSLYAQDDWKVTSKLTLNLGLQWSLDSPYTERYNNVSWFDPRATPPSSKALGFSTIGSLVFASGNQRKPDDTYYRQWAPRFGFAYQVRQNTVVRGGYGIFWLPSTATTIRTAAPTYFRTTQPYIASIDGGTTPANRLSNPFPTGVFPVPGNSPTWDTRVTNLSGITERDAHAGYMQNWNIDVQRDMGHALALDVAYAGSKGTGLPGVLGINQLPLSNLALGTALNAQVPNPYFGYVKTGNLSTATVSRAQLLRPFPQFESVTLGPQNIGSSIYHSLQAKATKRLFSSSLLGVAYTFSKFIDDTDGSIFFNEQGVSSPTRMNYYNLQADRSLDAFDAPHRLVFSYTVELPWKGKDGLAGRLISGWEATGLLTLQSGTPIFLQDPGTPSMFAATNRPNNNGTSGELEGSAQSRLTRWFNTSAFSRTPAFTFGNSSRTSPDIRIDGISNWDAGFFKNNRFGADERFNVQFRAEFFNTLNRARFGYPGSTVGQANFGVISTQINRPRQIQFALKLQF